MKKQLGFTLIELLVVIAIIGLLASVVLVALSTARAKSRDAKRLADVRQFASALELYFNDKSAYPTSAAAVSAWVTLNTSNAPGLSPAYIGSIPTSPNPPDNATGGTCTATNNPYRYSVPNATGAFYEIMFCLGDQTGAYPAGQRILSPGGIR